MDLCSLLLHLRDSALREEGEKGRASQSGACISHLQGFLKHSLLGLTRRRLGPAQQLTFLTSSQAMLLLLGQETFRDPLVTKPKNVVVKNTDSESQTTLVQILAPPLRTV